MFIQYPPVLVYVYSVPSRDFVTRSAASRPPASRLRRSLPRPLRDRQNERPLEHIHEVDLWQVYLILNFETGFLKINLIFEVEGFRCFDCKQGKM